MTGRIAVDAIGMRRGVLIMALALLPVLLLAPRAVSGADKETMYNCTKLTWSDYNDCLVEARSWISRTACDISWQLEIVECIAQEMGEVLKALDGKTNEPN